MTSPKPNNTQTLPERTLVSMGTDRSPNGAPFTIQDAEKVLRNLERKQAPIDAPAWMLSGVYVEFPKQGGHVEANLVKDGRAGGTVNFTSQGLSQLAGFVLPGHFFPGLKKLANLDAGGSELATKAWNKFSSVSTRDVLVRTVLDDRIMVTVTDPETKAKSRVPQRVIRSVASMKYCRYSNVEMIEDIKVHAGAYASLPVLSLTVTDNQFRMRFKAVDEETEIGEVFDPNFSQSQLLPMVECWNSETKCRSLGFRGGIHKTVHAYNASFGLGHWMNRSEINRKHVGNARLIRASLVNAFKDLFDTAREVKEAYEDASDVRIHDPVPWVTMKLNNTSVPDRVVEKACEMMKEANVFGVSPKGKKTVKFTDLIDAVCIAATLTETTDVQYKVDQSVSLLMKKTLDWCVANNNYEVNA
jgi:hypothetical protein